MRTLPRFLIALCLLAHVNCSRAKRAAPADNKAPADAAAGGQAAPQDAQGYIALGTELYRNNRDREAVEAFRRAAELEPDNPLAHYRLGLAHGALGERDEAEAAYAKALEGFEKAVKDDPKNADALLSLADVYSRTGEYEKSIEAYRKASKLKEPDAYTYYDMGLVYNRLARYDDAAKAFRQAVELNPDDYRAQEALERAEEDHKRQKTRVEHAKRQLEKQQRAAGNANDANGNNANSLNANGPAGTPPPPPGNINRRGARMN